MNSLSSSSTLSTGVVGMVCAPSSVHLCCANTWLVRDLPWPVCKCTLHQYPCIAKVPFHHVQRPCGPVPILLSHEPDHMRSLYSVCPFVSGYFVLSSPMCHGFKLLSFTGLNGVPLCGWTIVHLSTCQWTVIMGHASVSMGKPAKALNSLRCTSPHVIIRLCGNS